VGAGATKHSNGKNANGTNGSKNGKSGNQASEVTSSSKSGAGAGKNNRSGWRSPNEVAGARGAAVTSANFGTSNFFSNYPLSLPELKVKSWFWAAAGIVVIVALWYVYISNYIPIQGDVVYKEAQNYTQIQNQDASLQDRALSYYAQAVQIEPAEDFYRLYLGESYLEKAQQVATATPANTAQISDYLKKSEAELLKAHELTPLNADHLANLGRLYSAWARLDPLNQQKYTATSINWFKQALVRAPHNAHLFNELSQVYLTNNQVNEALDAAKTSVGLDADFDEGRVALGQAYLAQGDKLNAGKQFAEAVRIRPRSLDDISYVNRIEALGTSPLVQVTDLIKYFTPPNDAAADDRNFDNVSLGIVYFYHNDMAQAENYLQQVLAAGQGSQNSPQGAYTFYAHLYMAQVYAATGRSQQAQTEAQTALSIVTNSGPAAQPLVKVAQDIVNKVKSATPTTPK
jgi:hypothetical protein